MADVFTKAKRSEVMGRIKGRDTYPERAVRSMIHRMGYRFRLHRTGLPGKPDIVLPRYKVVILVHGCFWHRHQGCRFSYIPKSRKNFWLQKFDSNVTRDHDVEAELSTLGWKVIIVWECELQRAETLASRLNVILKRYRSP